MPASPEPGFAPPDGLRWLYVDFNSYFASVEQQLDPRLRGRPVAVIPVETDSTCAIAASYEAKAFGVKTGTPIYEARKMCPGLVCVLARHEHYTAFHHRLIEEINRHIPVSAVCSIDEMVPSPKPTAPTAAAASLVVIVVDDDTGVRCRTRSPTCSPQSGLPSPPSAQPTNCGRQNCRMHMPVWCSTSASRRVGALEFQGHLATLGMYTSLRREEK